MALDFESFQAAIFQRLSDTLGADIKNSTRQFLAWDDKFFAKERLPALMVVAEKASAQREMGCPSIWTMRVGVAILARTPIDTKQTVETLFFGLLKKVDAALKRQIAEPWDSNLDTTLGIPNLVRCFRTEHEIAHGVGPDEISVIAFAIELVANDFE